MAGMKIDETW